jgi:NitT/TauT family transport system substrate-binding protein
MSGTQGAGETIQAVISGSADIGAGVGAAGVMRAFSKGAPVRILAPCLHRYRRSVLVRKSGL